LIVAGDRAVGTPASASFHGPVWNRPRHGQVFHRHRYLPDRRRRITKLHIEDKSNFAAALGWSANEGSMMDMRLSALIRPILLRALPLPFANAQTNGRMYSRSKHDGPKPIAENEMWTSMSPAQREGLGEAKTHLYPRFDTSVLAASCSRRSIHHQSRAARTFSGTGPIPTSNTNFTRLLAQSWLLRSTVTSAYTINSYRLSVTEQRLKIDAAQLSFGAREQKLADDVRRRTIKFSSRSSSMNHSNRREYLEALLHHHRRASQQGCSRS